MSLGLVFPEDISVWINGEEIGAVKGWSSVSQRELYEVQAMEEQEPKALLPYGEHHRVTLDRLSSAAPGELRALSDFRITLKEKGRNVLFSGCEWQEFEEEMGLSGPAVIRAVLTARSREEEDA
ncbi:MAG TPA: hypothetical protein IAA54_00330 [Candidatus Gallacutalibacter pullicola]|uniref:Uncharacterized protein n=1 Tax=Candidatus Gallacutalibacter pullicola TaxID=2840830 RepID=A0A9D1J0K4_9FIRM|nr:hypothetical protein [Candidatus Gallacutalibacter pullicola]